LQDVIDIRVCHTVISRGLIERYGCKTQILLVGIVCCGISDELAVYVNTVTMIRGEDEH
jgi:hypothetical protein